MTRGLKEKTRFPRKKRLLPVTLIDPMTRGLKVTELVLPAVGWFKVTLIDPMTRGLKDLKTPEARKDGKPGLH